MFNKAHKDLLKWYKENGRHELPWRLTTDPYKIYISEIMLQQTQVKTVLERFYFPFLEAFPTVEDLAKASEDEVLKQWEGLGYYTRARNVHKLARLVQNVLPKEVEALVALPGIGQSTAHAIASFAYKTPVPILDANIKRVLYRVFALENARDKELWEYAYRLFDTKHPYEYNQSMMDLGSMVCTKATPLCSECPLRSVCIGCDTNPMLFPTQKVKKRVPVHFKDVLIYKHKEMYGMYQRTTRFLGGLWGFVQVDHDSEHLGEFKGEVEHKYSHFHVKAKVYVIEEEHEACEWFSFEAIETIAISKLDEKALRLL